MVTFTAADDRRQSYKANQSRRAVNAARQRKATVGNVDWAMSRPADWYTELDDQEELSNLRSIKDTLVNQQGNRDFWTTDQDESRNAYQMLMNQMKGGDRGARMMDLRGLPAATQANPNRYRRGRTMFQDPSKAQGFFGDVGSLFSGNNRAAVYADEYNPFPKAGFGEQVYKDKFPIASGLGSLMETAENFIPGIGMAKRMLTREREPLERDLSYAPNPYDELPMLEFEDELETVEEVSDVDLLAPYVENSLMEIQESPYHGRGELSEDFDYSQFPSSVDEDITENLEEIITEDDGEEEFVLKEAKFPQGNLGWIDPVTTEENYDYNPIWDLNIMNIQDYELKKKATDAAIQFNNLWKSKKGKEDKSDMYELEKLYDEYLAAVEAGAQPEDSLIEDINLTEDDFEGVAFDFDKNLEDQSESLNEIERLKNIQRDNNFLFDI